MEIITRPDKWAQFTIDQLHALLLKRRPDLHPVLLDRASRDAVIHILEHSHG